MPQFLGTVISKQYIQTHDTDNELRVDKKMSILGSMTKK